jgi:hypothetical protein
MVAITRFKADHADADEVRARHTALVSVIRSVAPGLGEARLGRLDDRTWVGIWRWDSAEHLRTARRDVADRPETAAAFALVTDVTGEEVELVDERWAGDDPAAPGRSGVHGPAGSRVPPRPLDAGVRR